MVVFWLFKMSVQVKTPSLTLERNIFWVNLFHFV